MILAGGHIFALELNTFCWYSSIPKWKIYKGKEIIMWAKIWKSIAHQVIWVAFLARLFFHLHCYVGQIALLTLDIPICIWVWVTGVDVKERAPPRLQSVSLSSGITQLCSKHFHFGLNTNTPVRGPFQRQLCTFMHWAFFTVSRYWSDTIR